MSIPFKRSPSYSTNLPFSAQYSVVQNSSSKFMMPPSIYSVPSRLSSISEPPSLRKGKENKEKSLTFSNPAYSGLYVEKPPHLLSLGNKKKFPIRHSPLVSAISTDEFNDDDEDENNTIQKFPAIKNNGSKMLPSLKNENEKLENEKKSKKSKKEKNNDNKLPSIYNSSLSSSSSTSSSMSPSLPSSPPRINELSFDESKNNTISLTKYNSTNNSLPSLKLCSSYDNIDNPSPSPSPPPHNKKKRKNENNRTENVINNNNNNSNNNDNSSSNNINININNNNGDDNNGVNKQEPKKLLSGGRLPALK